MIAELYRFYQIEAGEAAEAQLEGEEVESEVGEADADFPSLTGDSSITDSNISDAEIPALTT